MNTFLKDTIVIMQRNTDINNHTQARIVACDYLNKKDANNAKPNASRAKKILNAIDVIHNFLGHMPLEINDVRNKAFELALQDATEEEIKAFNSAL